jgi:BioD-like phosphotransacetylase family protein
MSSAADIVIVEGSTALSPEEHRRLAETLDAKILAVVAYSPDIPSDALTSWLTGLGDRTVGAVVNGLTRHRGRDAEAALMPSIGSDGVTTLGVVPEDRRLLGVSVGQIAQHLDGRFVSGEDGSDVLVEHLMVGGMGMDPGEYYFGIHESKAVIVRGDRPDLQMAALKTSTACLVMTKGIEPIEYVQYEAREEEVPVIVVETDTLGTMEALNGLMDSARFDHSLKLARYSELADEHIDLPALYDALGLTG